MTELKCEALPTPFQEAIAFPEKCCSRCQFTKPLTDFGIDRNRKSGVNPLCKECRRAEPRKSTANENNSRYRAKLKARETIETPTEKRCCSCKITKPADQFHRNKSDPDGIARRCKVCKASEHRSRYEARIGVAPSVDEKWCQDCEATKPADEFYRQTSARDGLSSYCVPCSRVRGLANYADNREDRILSVWRWQKENPEMDRSGRISSRSNRRTQEAGADGSFSPKEWRDLVYYYGNHCAYCCRHESQVGKMTADHVTPLSRGGSGFIDNILPACLSCNGTKRDKTLLEFVLWKTEMEKIFGPPPRIAA